MFTYVLAVGTIGMDAVAVGAVAEGDVAGEDYVQCRNTKFSRWCIFKESVSFLFAERATVAAQAVAAL